MSEVRDASPHNTPTAAGTGATSPHRAALENSVIWTLWLTYGAFYFCRQNLSTAVPGMKAAVSEGGLALSGDQVGWILAALKIAYGIGQLINGQLSERVSPRVMLAIGMFGSAALNVLFGLGTGFYFFLFVWAMNGFCQSLGWTPCVRVVANWIPIERRGRAIGIIGTGYQITLGLTYLIAGQAAEHLGWRGALYVPAALLASTGLFMLVCLRKSPEEASADNNETGQRPAQQAPRPSLPESIYWTLYNPALWLLGTTLLLLNACRYGYFDWGLSHLMEVRQMPVGKAVMQYFVIAIGATAGSYLAGWATDRFFGSRRAPVICILLVALGGLSLVYESAVERGALEVMLLLVAIGFCIIGPQVLLVGTAPADLAHRGTSAAAAGFVNFMGYLGAAMGDVVTGYYSAPAHGGWHTAIHIWAGWAFAGAAVTAILWNTTSQRIGVMSGIVPKLAAVAAMVAAAMAIGYDGQSEWLRFMAYGAAACAAASFTSRMAAVPVLIAAIVGLLTVFISYAQTGGDIAWHQTVGMAAFGLTIIAAVMILVEQKSEPTSTHK